MYSGLLIVLLPLLLGYLIPLRQARVITLINPLLNSMVYLILFFMGITLAFLDNLSNNLGLIFQYTAVFFICIIGTNLLLLHLLEQWLPWHAIHRPQSSPSRLLMALESFKLCAVIIIGCLLGLTQWQWLTYASHASQYALILLLLLVGLQLRHRGLRLRNILLNPQGMFIGLTVACSSLAGGALAASLLGMPIKTGLALASGYGWYSLSGIMITDAFGPLLGSTAFFNDLARELFAMMLIPCLISRSHCCALGLCGATSMDFTLPVLQHSGGTELVPSAIVHGFMLSLLAPILMAVFST